MANISKQELAAQLNTMQGQGATPEQITAAINAAGYDQLTDFATNESGQFSSLSPQDQTSKLSELTQTTTSTLPSPEPATTPTKDDPVVSNANTTSNELLRPQTSSGLTDTPSTPNVTKTQTSSGVSDTTTTNASRDQVSSGQTDTPTSDAATRSQISSGLSDTPPADSASRSQVSSGVSDTDSTNAARSQASSGLSDTPPADTPTRSQASSGLSDTPPADTPTRSQASSGLSDTPPADTPTRSQASSGQTDTPASDTPTRSQASSGQTDTPASDTPAKEQQSSGVDGPVAVGEVGKPQSYVEEQEASAFAVSGVSTGPAKELPKTEEQGDTTAVSAMPKNLESTGIKDPDPTVIATKEITIPEAELPEGVVAESYPVKDQQSPNNEEYPPEQSSSARSAVSEPESQTSLDNSVWTSPYDATPVPAKTLDELQKKVSDSADGAVSTATDTVKKAAESNLPSVAAGVLGAKSSNDVEAKLASSSDWRFRISIANGASYLYGDTKNEILAPLSTTKGVVFPYTPNITMAYSANYDKVELPHTNYNVYNYKNSMVDQISIVADFTAQDSKEAAYLLAVIHFFKSATKMFYGQDPLKGMPPPICFLNGFGQYHFNDHPVVIVSFNYTYKNDVDYIDAYVSAKNSFSGKSEGPKTVSEARQTNSGVDEIKKKFMGAATNLTKGVGNSNMAGGTGSSSNSGQPTKVPTKIELSLTCYPIVSRKNVSNNFNFGDYASGKLLQGKTNGFGGGFW